MAKSKMHTDYLRMVKNTKKALPFSLLPAQIAENSGNYAYPLRRNTVATTVKLHQPILEAIRMYVCNESSAIGTPYMLIAQQTIGANGKIQPHYILETIDEVGDTLLVDVVGDKLRVSKVVAGNPDDREPLPAFPQQTPLLLTVLTLALLPRILQIDEEKGAGKLGAVVEALRQELEDAHIWIDVNDIPEMTKEHLYFTDAAYHILDQMDLDFGDASTTIPGEVDSSVFQQPSKVKGSLVCQFLNYPAPLGTNWTPRFIEADGTQYRKAAQVLTVGLAKQQFSSFSAHRSWSPMEQMLIPEFPDDMPVMPEVLRMAGRICKTTNDTNPVRNVMWRSDTGFGKSTGTRQLACILGLPYLVMTCHPGMEVQEFKSNFVPSAADAVELDMTSVASPVTEDTQVDRPPYFAEAVAHVAALDGAQRDALLDARRFYGDIMVCDTDELAQMVIGSQREISIDDLCWLYAEVRSAVLHEAPLRKKVERLEATVQKDGAAEQRDNGKPDFVHVVSNYVKAMVNGYVCEIQEASRIRDSGVLVGLNEFDRPGAVIPLMNGALARRHKDAVCIITDNVGYDSCRPIDPSVLRRQGFIIDSVGLSKEQLLDRVKRNTGCSDQALLDMAYGYWHTVKEYCEQNSITEGSVSPMELERFVQALMYDGLDLLDTDLDDCIISKATSSVEDQKGIRTACQVARAA